MKIKYDDNVLLKLRREYKKDETIAYVLNKINEFQERNEKLHEEINRVRIENKELKYKRQPKSEIDSLKIEIRELQEKIRFLTLQNNSLKLKI